MKNLKDTEDFYNCLSSTDKLRVLFMLLPRPLPHLPDYEFKHPVIGMDLDKVLTDIKQRTIFDYLNEFARVGLITKSEFGKNRLYYFSDEKNMHFVQNIRDQINDTILEQDWMNFSNKYRGFLLVLSKLTWDYNKDGEIKVFKFKGSHDEFRRQRENIVIGKCLDQFADAIEHKRKDQIEDLKIKLVEMNVTWNRFPGKYKKYLNLLKSI